MISFFPSIYPDELLYSQLARYYNRAGYTAYISAAEDLYTKKTTRPVVEFLNEFNEEAITVITKEQPLDEIINKHTMFPYYGRFLDKKRREKAFNALLTTKGRYYDLLKIPRNKSKYLKYCPMCVEKDRAAFGETYWHRVHQMAGVDICPTHGCYLVDSTIVNNSKTSPCLISAEEAIEKTEDAVICENAIAVKLGQYIEKIFNSDIDIKCKVPIGDFLHSRMERTKYRSTRGQQRNMHLLFDDFSIYYRNLDNSPLTQEWQLEKLFNNYRTNMVDVCMLAMFLNIPPEDFTSMKLPKKSQQQLFDEEVYRLHKQGLKYPEIAKRLNSSINIVKPIGERRYKKPHIQAN